MTEDVSPVLTYAAVHLAVRARCSADLWSL